MSDVRSELQQLIDAAEVVQPTGEDSRLVIRRAAQVDPRPIKWFWRDRIPSGAICLMMGMPNQGKSTLTTDIAARVSTGTPWPLGSDRTIPTGDVAILTGEESAEQIIVPRLRAAGADLNRVHLIESVERYGEHGATLRSGFDIATDVERLRVASDRLGGFKLVIIDPLNGFIGSRVDIFRGNSVREALRPLKEWADKSGATVLIVHHLNKSPSSNALDRVSGARSFGAMPRSIWLVAADRDATPGVNRSVLAPMKWNCSPSKPPATRYEIRPSADDPSIPVVAWLGDEVDADGDSLLRTDSNDDGLSAKDEAIEFLQQTLANGPRLTRAIKKEAKELGIAEATLYRAKESIGIKSDQLRNEHQIIGWAWKLREKTT